MKNYKITILIAVIIIAIIFASIYYLISFVYTSSQRPCLKERIVTKIEAVKYQAGWYGKEKFKFLIYYDDGSVHDTLSPRRYYIGEIECLKK